jgi:hypothetical protein
MLNAILRHPVDETLTGSRVQALKGLLASDPKLSFWEKLRMAKKKETTPVALTATVSAEDVNVLRKIFLDTKQNGNSWINLADGAKFGTLIEMSATAYNTQGQAACRLTDAGEAYLKQAEAALTAVPVASTATTWSTPSTPAPTPMAVAVVQEDDQDDSMGFVIEDNIPVPPKGVFGGGRKLYPFDALAVGQSFFVPATAEKPTPHKSLGGSVQAANKRHAGQRKFIVAKVDGGARVWRSV